jgi:hypothetical protein
MGLNGLLRGSFMLDSKIKNTYNKVSKHKNLVILSEKICKFLIFLFVILIIYSFSITSRGVVTLGADSSGLEDGDKEWQRTIKNPRLQVENVDSFSKLKAERGYFVNDDELLFENATMTSTLGTLEAEKVIITEDFTNINVTGNPKLIIYPETTEKLTE